MGIRMIAGLAGQTWIEVVGMHVKVLGRCKAYMVNYPWLREVHVAV